MRYIDADKLLTDELTHTLPIGCGRSSGRVVVFVDDIEKQPTADAVEVVRCKDCKFWGIPHANDIEKPHYCCRDNMWCMPLRLANDYCSYGERSGNGT